MGANAWLASQLGLVVGILIAALVALAVVATRAFLRVQRLEQRHRDLTAGAGGGTLDDVLDAHVREVRAIGVRAKELNRLMDDLERASRTHLQRVGFARFNPFRDAGGDQSFALALADRDGNGVVLSSLHSRDVTRLYGKPLTAWTSIYPLTEEEQRVLAQAQAGMQQE